MSHVLKPLSQAGATMRQLDIPGCSGEQRFYQLAHGSSCKKDGDLFEVI